MERTASPLAQAVRARRLTYLSETRLAVLEDYADRVRDSGGDLVEAGVALGGSAIVLSARLGDVASFHGYDVFEMIPPPAARDDERSHERYSVIASGRSEGIAGDTYYGYLPDLLDRVHASFDELGHPVDGERVHLHRGLFEDTFDPPGPIGLAHIDSDWFDPVALCLERVHRRLIPGGFVVLDDYGDYGGCRQATDEFLAQHDDMALVEAPENVVLQRIGRAA